MVNASILHERSVLEQAQGGNQYIPCYRLFRGLLNGMLLSIRSKNNNKLRTHKSIEHVIRQMANRELGFLFHALERK
jgi:hypothetical protein